MDLPVALIPAYKPTEEVINVAKQLINSKVFEAIYCVDDGSGSKYHHIFTNLENLGVNILRHAVNMGKGMALKTGFNVILSNYPNSCGVVTVDADGQHLPDDVVTIAKTLYDNRDKLILGCRSFQKNNIPFRSKFGNLLTKKVFSIVSGLNISDTQTGLRGIPIKLIPNLLRLKTTSYDFELDMLICAKNCKIKYKEIHVNTVYEEGNPTSSFNPLTDSFKIYFVFLRYAWVGLLSFIIDFISFLFLFHILSIPITYSNVLARGISSTFNFILNRKFVFKSKSSIFTEYIKYSILVTYIITVNTSILYFAYNYVSKFSVGIKLSAEILTFLFAFIVAKNFVFRKKD